MPRDLTLAIDVGNSRIKFGLFDCAPRAESAPTLPVAVAVVAWTAAKPGDWGKITALCNENSARISSAVVAGANPAAVEMIRSSWPNPGWPVPQFISRSADLPLRTSVEFPDKVGIDRLLNAVAANVLRPADRAAVVVSAGTATTIDLIIVDGTFAGGAILPGLELGARALHEHTALLPLIDVPALVQQPVEALGRDTHAAISSGLWHGQIGAIRELATRLTASTVLSPVILVTGGNGRWLAPALGPDFRFEADLALRGLAFVAQAEAGLSQAVRGNAQ